MEDYLKKTEHIQVSRNQTRTLDLGGQGIIHLSEGQYIISSDLKINNTHDDIVITRWAPYMDTPLWKVLNED